MDEDLRRSIRNLGRGFHAGLFSTKELLGMLHIKKIYLASGIIEGIFLRPQEVVEAVAHYQDTGYLITKFQLERIQAWAAAEKQEDISVDCHAAREWFPPADRGKSDLDITVIDLENPKPTCCYDSRVTGGISQLSGYVTSGSCPNKCGGTPCIQHIVMCRGCEKDLCHDCVATFVNDAGISVDVFKWDGETHPMCGECHPDCFFDDLCQKCIDLS